MNIDTPRTIHRLWAVLHSALEYAVRTDRLAANPASHPSLPRVEKEEPRTLSRDQVRRLIAALAEEPDRALYAFELTTGMREARSSVYVGRMTRPVQAWTSIAPRSASSSKCSTGDSRR